MAKKNSLSQMAQPINRLIIKDLSAELVELSENDLQQLIGGIAIERLICGEIARSYRLGSGWVQPQDRPRESI